MHRCESQENLLLQPRVICEISHVSRYLMNESCSANRSSKKFMQLECRQSNQLYNDQMIIALCSSSNKIWLQHSLYTSRCCTAAYWDCIYMSPGSRYLILATGKVPQYLLLILILLIKAIITTVS